VWTELRVLIVLLSFATGCVQVVVPSPVEPEEQERKEEPGSDAAVPDPVFPADAGAPAGDSRDASDHSAPADSGLALDAKGPPDLGGGDAIIVIDSGFAYDAGSGLDAGAAPDAAPAPTQNPQRTPGYLHTRGGRILDHTGAVVRITGINWFGLETPNYAPHGLWQRSLSSMIDQIASLGFNTIRLPFCSQLFDQTSTPNGIDLSQNPQLRGKSGLEIMDAVITEARARGLKVILDRHRPSSSQQSELWYTGQYAEQRWIDDWRMLARRYLGDTTVIGFDLHNEPHGPATWGTGDMATDWRLAAQRAGDAILTINPELLIFVEGVENVGGQFYWWGGNLRGARAAAVALQVPDQVVYSPHDYPASVYAQSWFSDPSYPTNLDRIWGDNWGYLVVEDRAPIMLGEFGTRFETQVDRQWLERLAGYIGANGLSFTYWSWNPNSGDTGGILQDDWVTVRQDKMAVLRPVLAPRLP
jgi:endoglucanase